MFSKLARAITLAAQSGGGDPGGNLRLHMAIDQARSANMPKVNITRAVERAKGSGGVLEEVLYEGYGPFGVAVIVEAATDNRNRTAQEIKNIFERSGGSLASPGSVSFQFEQKGLILVEKGSNVENAILSLIDLGVPDVEETDDGIEVFAALGELATWRQKIGDGGFGILSAELVYKPKTYISVGSDAAGRVLGLIESLDDYDDVQRVFTNIK